MGYCRRFRKKAFNLRTNEFLACCIPRMHSCNRLTLEVTYGYMAGKVYPSMMAQRMRFERWIEAFFGIIFRAIYLFLCMWINVVFFMLLIFYISSAFNLH